jgi:hypothetical protein
MAADSVSHSSTSSRPSFAASSSSRRRRRTRSRSGSCTRTHAFDAADASPYLAVTSPEKRSGKSRLLEVLEIIVFNSWKVITPTEAVVFRKIDAHRPTLLLDETDAIFGKKNGENYEGLRALLNAGNRRGTKVPRCVGTSQSLQSFSVFCPKAIAGIGELPDTIADRAIPIRLKRKARSERAERFRRRDVEADAKTLYMNASAWAEHARPDARRGAARSTR